ncbi:hypothetical protein LTR37_014460 [Vermiconidia calcicola]|uniref:Uncharacterized protein n=1 Tax=Vermiconidia calcicola TaxID=1690605 RepID=A0ACC3MTL6_9PEZI|nr:hypothetical protein LTR37_014460 [Vermiconidia calcicola]
MDESEDNNGIKREASLSIPKSTVAHFSAIPWVRTTLDDRDFHIVSMSRTITHSGHGHTLMAKTWNTDDTIKELLSLVRRSPSSVLPQSEDKRTEVRRFYTLGGDLNAHPDLLHGGVISCILDSSLGAAVGATHPHAASSFFTVQLNVTYKNPVRTPGTVMVQSWVTKSEGGGRKVWAKGMIASEGVVHAEAEGLWVRAKGNSEKL